MSINVVARGHRLVDLENPRPSDFDLDTIAHALAGTIRFSGHPVERLTVAQHCVMVSRLCAREDAFAGLMHELDEVFLPDVPGPLKVSPEMAWYRKLCDAHYVAGAERWGLPLVLPASVLWADATALATEVRDLWNDDPNGHPWCLQLPPAPMPIGRVLDPLEARHQFISRFHELYKRPSWRVGK